MVRCWLSISGAGVRISWMLKFDEDPEDGVRCLDLMISINWLRFTWHLLRKAWTWIVDIYRLHLPQNIFNICWTPGLSKYLLDASNPVIVWLCPRQSYSRLWSPHEDEAGSQERKVPGRHPRLGIMTVHHKSHLSERRNINHQAIRDGRMPKDKMLTKQWGWSWCLMQSSHATCTVSVTRTAYCMRG